MARLIGGGAIGSLRVLMVVACSAVLVDASLQAAITPLLPYLAERFGLSGAEIGLLAAAYPAGVVAAALPTGTLIGRYGPRTVLVAAATVLAIACVLLALAHGAALFALARLLQGGAASLSWGGAFTWVVRASPAPHRSQLIGALLGVGMAGTLTGPLLAVTAEVVGPRPIFGLLAIPCAVVCVACLSLPAPEVEAASRTVTARAFRNWRMFLGLWLIALVGMTFGGVMVLGTLRLDGVGATTAEIAAVLIIASACQVVLNPVVGRLADRHGPLGLIRTGLAATAVVLLVFSLPTSLALQAAAVLACLCAITAIWGPATALLSETAASVDLPVGSLFAVVNLAWAVGNVLGTAGAGALSAERGSAATGLVAGIATTCLVAVIVTYRRDD